MRTRSGRIKTTRVVVALLRGCILLTVRTAFFATDVKRLPDVFPEANGRNVDSVSGKQLVVGGDVS